MPRTCAAVAIVGFWCWTDATVSGRGAVYRVERTGEAMGSSFSVILHGPVESALDLAADAALNEAHRLDALLSNYRPASEWSLVNRDAGERPVRVSEELFALLDRCLEYSRRSEGPSTSPSGRS